jgi:RNA polymerase sigma factor (sigma-70 family)
MSNETLLHRVKIGQRLHARGLLAYSLRSLDAPVGSDPDSPTLMDALGEELAVAPDQEAGLLARDRRRTLARGWRELDARERRVLAERFGANEKTLEEIGDRLNLSRERVRQLERGALAALRRVVAGQPARPVPPRARALAIRAALRRLDLPAGEREELVSELEELRSRIAGEETGA